MGSDKSRLLTAQNWLRDIDRDFAGMNAAWGEWVDPKAVPTRATCEARLQVSVAVIAADFIPKYGSLDEVQEAPLNGSGSTKTNGSINLRVD
ncbi:hypothetical protein B0E49_12120 [Polaromonas sp. C04]|nr:hypothetical protein B0E49_12120 [Polaromonas sp. C04]